MKYIVQYELWNEANDSTRMDIVEVEARNTDEAWDKVEAAQPETASETFQNVNAIWLA